MRRFLTVLLCMMITGGFGAIANAAPLEKVISQSFEFTPGGSFTLKNYRGAVRVESGNYSAIEFQGLVRVNCPDESDSRKLLEDTRLVVERHDPGNLSLKVVTDEEFIQSLQNSGISGLFSASGTILEIDCVIKVPHEVSLDVATYKGAVSVRDIEGAVKVKDYKGEVVIDNIDGNVFAETYKAPLVLNKIDGRITAKNYKGSIRVEAYSLADDASLEVSNYKDEIVLSLPDGINADLNIKNEKGETNSDFPMSVFGNISESNFKAKLNAGGTPIRISNYKGTVQLKKR